VNVQVNEVPVRRLAGIDLGVASEHTVRVLDGAGQKMAAARCVPSRESLLAVETRALAGTPAGTRLEVVLEPTGPAWFPVARFFAARGHKVFRVSSAKAADLRKWTAPEILEAPVLGEDEVMPEAKRYPSELRERAVKMVYEVRERSGQEKGAVARVAGQLGVGRETVNIQVPGWMAVLS